MASEITIIQRNSAFYLYDGNGNFLCSSDTYKEAQEDKSEFEEIFARELAKEMEA